MVSPLESVTSFRSRSQDASSQVLPKSEVDLDLKKSMRANCVASLRNKLTGLREEQKGRSSRVPSIWRVHEHLKRLDPESYVPMLVSIGPLHHGKSELSSMECVKLEYLREFLKGQRELDPLFSLDFIFDKVLDCLHQVRDEYSEKISQSDEELAEMLVVDGFFLTGYLIQKSYPNALECLRYLSKDIRDIKHPRSDLLLFENQIPFFILGILYQMTTFPLAPWRAYLDIVSLALAFLQIEPPPNLLLNDYPLKKEVRHLLHLQHLVQDPGRINDQPLPVRSYVQFVMFPVEKLISLLGALFLGLFYLLLFHNLSGYLSASDQSEIPRRIPSAMELHQAGIKFKRKAIPKEYKKVGELKVSFRDGKLEIPPFLVSDSTSKKLRNFIAFEQCYRKVPFHYTDYCVFMDHLIKTAEDVAILRRYGILESMLGSDSEVADMFNGLCKKVLWNHERNYLADVYKEVVNFCRVPQHRWRANLLHDYFHSPWTVFSVMAGAILLTFTITQTIFTIYSTK